MANQKVNKSLNEDSLYVAVDEPKPTLQRDQPQSGLQREPEYLALIATTANEESLYATSSPIPDKENTNGHSRKIFRLVAIVTLVAMLVLIACLIISCLVAVFVEIGMLKTATRELQQASVDTQAANLTQLSQSIEFLYQQLGQVNDSLSQQMQISDQQLRQELFQRLDTSISMISEFLPIPSCAALLALSPSAPSGEYRVISSSGSAVRVYCDMTLSCGGVTGGWTRVAELNTTDSSQQCPSGFIQRFDGNIRTCGPPGDRCAAATFPVVSEYDKVCGRIIAFQRASPDTFQRSSTSGGATIESNYLDGVSLTHGSPRQHIWSFAAGLDETEGSPGSNCACTRNFTGDITMYSQPPAFVGNDYFCATGSRGQASSGTFYDADPLWDGAGCGPMNTCCSFNNPPWFYRQLPQPTIDAIEMRLCTDQDRRDEDIQIQTVEIFVQ